MILQLLWTGLAFFSLFKITEALKKINAVWASLDICSSSIHSITVFCQGAIWADFVFALSRQTIFLLWGINLELALGKIMKKAKLLIKQFQPLPFLLSCWLIISPHAHFCLWPYSQARIWQTFACLSKLNSICCLLPKILHVTTLSHCWRGLIHSYKKKGG